MSELHALIERYAQPGRVEAILLRPERLAVPVSVTRAGITADGIVGDHGRPGKHAVTLIQAEHLPIIGAMLDQPALDASVLRRDLVISRLNLNALKGRQLQIGQAVLEITTICAPCSRMEAALGPGGYSAMRGHGGWCANVVKPGEIKQCDTVTPLAVKPNLNSDA